jgi:UPF0755 protein
MRQTRSRAAIIAVLLLGLLIFFVVYQAWNTVADVFQPASPTGQGKQVAFKIHEGESTAQIADDLQSKGLIRNALAFRVWARVKGLDTHLQAGVYKKINSSMTIDKIVDELLNAQPDAITVTILEGWRLEQMANQFSSAGLVKFKKDDFLKYTKQAKTFPDYNNAKYSSLLKLIPANQSMEGLLFPASYDVPVDADARKVIDSMLDSMLSNVQNSDLEQQAKQHQMSLYQMLTLASIVEREAVFPGDRGNIASVYWNRTFKPSNETVGLLQADPTVQYARDNQGSPQKYWQPLQTTGTETATDSPWNTYTHKGLPPTPICSPGLASMKAAAAPPQTGYYYFFAYKGGHGASKFAKTQQEFEQLKQQFEVNNG